MPQADVDHFLTLRLYSSVEVVQEFLQFPDSIDISDPRIERIALKRLKTVEKKSLHPVVDIAFFEGQLLDANNNNNNNNNKDSDNSDVDKHTGTYRQLQCISPTSSVCHDNEPIGSETQGYLLFAFKTMEHMSTVQFTSQWKTWTGARLLCQSLPDNVQIKRLSFLKKISGGLDFEFLMLAHMPSLLIYAPIVLNAVNYVRPRINAFVGAYRQANFKAHTSLGGRLCARDSAEETVETYCLRITVNNHSAKLLTPEMCSPRLHVIKEQIESDNQNIHGRKVHDEETQTEPLVEDRTRNGQTQTEQSLLKALTPEEIQRRHSICSIPRTIPIHDFAKLFAADAAINDKPKAERKKGVEGMKVTIADDRREQAVEDTPELICTNNVTRRKHRSRSATLKPSTTFNIRKADEDPETFFRKLREKYFNSPDYDRDDRSSSTVSTPLNNMTNQGDSYNFNRNPNAKYYRSESRSF